MSEKANPSIGDRSEGSSRQTASTGRTGTPSRRQLLYLLGAGGVTGLAGCSSNPGGGTEQSPGGRAGSPTETKTEKQRQLRKSATIGIRDDITSDFQKYIGGVSPDYTRIFEPLTWATQDLKIKPWLATEWRATGDKTWEFDIREDVKFHNGKPLNADAVVFSLKELLTTAGSWIYTWAKTRPDGVKKKDDMTVEITNTKAAPGYPGKMTHLIFSIQHPDRSQGNPIGTGPYQFEGKKDGQRVTVSAFEDYWQGPMQKTEKLTYRILTDRNTRALTLKGGKIDVGHELPTSQFESIENAKSTNAKTQAQQAPVWVAFEDSPPTTDIKLRKGLNYAVSQQTVIDGSQNGIGIPARGPVPKIVWWSAHDSLPEYGPDKAKAKSLVANSKYDGETLKLFADARSEIPSVKVVAQILQQSAKEVGVDVEIKMMEGGAFDEAKEKQKGDLYLIQDSIPRVGNLFLFNQDPTRNYLKSLEGFEGVEEIQSLAEKARQSHDRSVMEESLRKAQHMVMDNALILPLFYKKYVTGMHTNIEFDLHPIAEDCRWETLEFFE